MQYTVMHSADMSRFYTSYNAMYNCIVLTPKGQDIQPEGHDHVLGWQLSQWNNMSWFQRIDSVTIAFSIYIVILIYLSLTFNSDLIDVIIVIHEITSQLYGITPIPFIYYNNARNDLINIPIYLILLCIH